MVQVRDLTELTVGDLWSQVKDEDEWWGEIKEGYVSGGGVEVKGRCRLQAEFDIFQGSITDSWRVKSVGNCGKPALRRF